MQATRSKPLSAEQRAALARIEGLVEYWRITTEELEGVLPTSPPARLNPGIKYRHPVTGDTWDGQGAQPDWLRRALLQEGYLVSELRPADTSADDRRDGGCTGG
ncbi:H-NS family nucleoid-associated regulatory protein [Aquabacterium sp.]|uniref:H-NS family nucleoid-associated regulatory protein n=1 Tax=Aquabacterium sp. TaxID=1872578 RepID=UPI002D084465|nr:H-NS family nucleoid-associated regulatory protein [Aquabacterium sp.]HSW06615.1 H-NS family nucleoid-associated regulatory protein [Aquabacterium sp.]